MSEVKDCENCIRCPVCRLYVGEMESRFGQTFRGDLVKALLQFRQELAENCSYYLEVK